MKRRFETTRGGALELSVGSGNCRSCGARLLEATWYTTDVMFGGTRLKDAYHYCQVCNRTAPSTGYLPQIVAVIFSSVVYMTIILTVSPQNRWAWLVPVVLTGVSILMSRTDTRRRAHQIEGIKGLELPTMDVYDLDTHQTWWA